MLIECLNCLKIITRITCRSYISFSIIHDLNFIAFVLNLPARNLGWQCMLHGNPVSLTLGVTQDKLLLLDSLTCNVKQERKEKRFN